MRSAWGTHIPNNGERCGAANGVSQPSNREDMSKPAINFTTGPNATFVICRICGFRLQDVGSNRAAQLAIKKKNGPGSSVAGLMRFCRCGEFVRGF